MNRIEAISVVMVAVLVAMVGARTHGRWLWQLVNEDKDRVRRYRRGYAAICFIAGACLFALLVNIT